MKKYNFEIDPDNKTVSFDVSSLLFPKSVIFSAAYRFIEDGKVIIGGNDKIIRVTIIPVKEATAPDLEELAYEFNIQLISSFVEDEESRKHAGIRETILKAAVLPQGFSSSPPLTPPSSYRRAAPPSMTPLPGTAPSAATPAPDKNLPPSEKDYFKKEKK